MDTEQQRRIQTRCLLILSAVAVGVALYWLQAAMIPFVLAVFLMYALSPVVDFQMRRLRMPRGVAVAATLLLGFLVLAALGGVIAATVSEMSDNAKVYQERLNSIVQKVGETVPLDWLGLGPEGEGDAAPSPVAGALGSLALKTAETLLGVLSKGVLVLLFLAFLLLGRSMRTASGDEVLGQVETQVNRYVVTMFIISLMTGVLVGLSLWVLGIKLALVFGLMAFLLNFIPNIGSVVATLLPIPMVILTPDVSPTTAVLAIALPSAIQFVIGNVVQPRLMGKSLDLHPVTVLLALIVWGQIWGIIGMILAAPITAVIRILMEKNELTAPVARLLAGRFSTPDDRPAE